MSELEMLSINLDYALQKLNLLKKMLNNKQIINNTHIHNIRSPGLNADLIKIASVTMKIIDNNNQQINYNGNNQA